MALSGFSDTNYISHGSAADIDNVTAGSLWLWLYPTSNTARQDGIVQHGVSRGFQLRGDVANDPWWYAISRATQSLFIEVHAANFAAWALNSWVFIAVTWDTTSVANCKMYMGNLTTSAAEPSAYATQRIGSGAVTDNSADTLEVGRAQAAGRDFQGRIARFGYAAKVLSLGEIRLAQRRHLISDGASVRILTDYATSAHVHDLSGKGHAGTVSGTLTTASHVPIPYRPAQRRVVPYTVAAAAAQRFNHGLLMGVN